MKFETIPFQTYGSICGGQTAMEDGLNCITNQNNEINNNNLSHTGYHTNETVKQNGGRRWRRKMYGGSNQTTCPQPPHILQGASAVNPLDTMCNGQQNLINAKVQGMYDTDVEYPFKPIQDGGKRKSLRYKRKSRKHTKTNKRKKRNMRGNTRKSRKHRFKTNKRKMNKKRRNQKRTYKR